MLVQLSKNSLDYSNYLFFLVFNCFGPTFQVLNIAIEDLVKCEQNRVNDLEVLKNIFLYSGIGILGGSFLFLTLYLLTIDSSLDSVWETLRLRAHRIFLQTRQLILERLAEIHHENEFIDELELNNYKKSRPLHFKHSRRYMVKFSILFIVSAIFFIVNAFVFYQTIENYLSSRTLLISTLAERRVLTTQLSFYTLEFRIQQTSYSIQGTFKNFTGIPYPQDGFFSVASKIDQTMRYFQDKNLKKLMSSQLEQSIYKNNSNTSEFLAFGTYVGLNYITQEGYYLAQDMTASLDEYREFFTNIMDINKIVKDNYLQANNDSKAVINGQLNNLIYFDGSCCFFLMLMMIGIYTPMLKFEISLLEKIIFVLKIIPNAKKIAERKKKKSIYSNKE